MFKSLGPLREEEEKGNLSTLPSPNLVLPWSSLGPHWGLWDFVGLSRLLWDSWERLQRPFWARRNFIGIFYSFVCSSIFSSSDSLSESLQSQNHRKGTSWNQTTWSHLNACPSSWPHDWEGGPGSPWLPLHPPPSTHPQALNHPRVLTGQLETTP